MIVAQVRGVDIVEVFENWAPRFRVVPTVKSLLEGTARHHLQGLGAVVLTNVEALNHERRRQRVKRKGRSVRCSDALALYHPRWNQQAPWIELFVDNIVRAWPNGKPQSSIATKLVFAEVFYHELGHHVHAEHRPEYRPKENVADAWSERMTHRFMLRNYWYLYIFAAPLLALWRLMKSMRQGRWRRSSRTHHDA